MKSIVNFSLLLASVLLFRLLPFVRRPIATDQISENFDFVENLISLDNEG